MYSSFWLSLPEDHLQPQSRSSAPRLAKLDLKENVDFTLPNYASTITRRSRSPSARTLNTDTASREDTLNAESDTLTSARRFASSTRSRNAPEDTKPFSTTLAPRSAETNGSENAETESQTSAELKPSLNVEPSRRRSSETIPTSKLLERDTT